MSKRFLLFGEKPFDGHALEKFSRVATDIERMSDIEALMYKESFDELVQKTVTNYSFKNIHISFENKMVDLVERHVNSNKRIFAEYSLVVSGDTYFLGLTPYNAPFTAMNLIVETRGNVMTFEIDTRYHNEELSPEVMAYVRLEYDHIKKYILDCVYNMNRTIMHYNSELEKFVIPLLANKLRKAERCVKIKEALNFK
jgi:hypothetical protein